MQWNKGYSSKYYATIVDFATMKDLNVDDPSNTRIEIIDGSIQRSDEGLRESADLTTEYYQITKELFIRVWLDTSQNGEVNHTPLFTGIASSPSREIEGRLEKTSMQCYSILKIADDVMLPRGWYAPYDIDCADLFRLLLSVTNTNIDIRGETPRLKHSIIAESGETNLSMVDKILSAISWTMRLDGYGNIILKPYDEEPSPIDMFDSIKNDIVEPSISIEYDWFNTPNIMRVVVDDLSAIARDDDPSSPLSTISRGREVWAEDTEGALNSNESISEYAVRMLKEYQSAATTISYDRRFIPDLYPLDCVLLNFPEQRLFGKYLIKSQTITLGFNAKTSEEVIQL